MSGMKQEIQFAVGLAALAGAGWLSYKNQNSVKQMAARGVAGALSGFVLTHLASSAVPDDTEDKGLVMFDVFSVGALGGVFGFNYLLKQQPQLAAKIEAIGPALPASFF